MQVVHNYASIDHAKTFKLKSKYTLLEHLLHYSVTYEL